MKGTQTTCAGGPPLLAGSAAKPCPDARLAGSPLGLALSEPERCLAGDHDRVTRSAGFPWSKWLRALGGGWREC
jgi:hypothetical protein